MLDYSFYIKQGEYNEIKMNIYKNKEIVLSARNVAEIQEAPYCIDLVPFLLDKNFEFEISLNNMYKGTNKDLRNKEEKVLLKIKDTVPFFYFRGKEIKGRYYMDCLDFTDVFKFYGIKGLKEII